MARRLHAYGVESWRYMWCCLYLCLKGQTSTPNQSVGIRLCRLSKESQTLPLQSISSSKYRTVRFGPTFSEREASWKAFVGTKVEIY